jgi:hypothetical protein
MRSLIIFVTILLAACSAQPKRVGCDGRLTPINAPAPAASAAPAASPAPADSHLPRDPASTPSGESPQ